MAAVNDLSQLLVGVFKNCSRRNDGVETVFESADRFGVEHSGDSGCHDDSLLEGTLRLVDE